MVRNPGGAYFRICFSFERLRLTFIPPALYLVRQIYGKELKKCRFLKGKFNKNGRLLLILTSKVTTFHRRKTCAHAKRLNHPARLTWNGHASRREPGGNVIKKTLADLQNLHRATKIYGKNKE